MAVRSALSVGEESLLARYPFLPGAERLIDGLSVTMEGLVEDPTCGRARELARRRVLVAANDPTAATESEEALRATPGERFLSYLYARLLVSAVPQGAAIRRWAVAEAKRAGAELAKAAGEEVAEVARRLDLGFEGGPREYSIPLVEYVRLATPIREAAFRLAQQRLRQGRVPVHSERAARLMQEGIRADLSTPMALAPELRSMVAQREREFLEELARRMPAPTGRPSLAPGAVRADLFPPCIRKMRRMLQGGENLSHSGRFALAAFLYRIGADTDAIVNEYRGAPDFDEGVTRYQVEHITRHAAGRGYEPPECATLRSHGLCFRSGDPGARDEADRRPDDRCFEPNLVHPLQYYRLRGGKSSSPD